MEAKDKHDAAYLEHVSEEGSPAPTAEKQLEEQSWLDDKPRAKKLVRKVDLHILPLCAWIYLLNYLDRGNIGNSKVLNEETGDDLLQQTGMTATGYAIAVSLFSLAYALLEVPSNWIMKRYTYAEVVVLRFFIGVFEAGFFPGIVFLITFWYPVQERSLRIAFVNASAVAAGAFGGCIAYGVGHLNGYDGLEGFRWLFIIEGLITVVCAALLVFFLPDYPSRAKFLNEDDKKFVEARVQVQGGGYNSTHSSKRELLQTIFSPRMLAHYLAYILDCVPLGSLTFFTPTIVTGLGFESIQAQLLTVPPWIVGYLMCLFLGWSADHFNARGWHITFASTLGAAGWLTAALLPADAYIQRYGCLMLCACGAFPSASPLHAWVTCNVPSITTMGIAIALNNSGAGVSQIIAQWIWLPEEAERGYPTGNFVCAGCSIGVALIATGLRIFYGRLNAKGARDARGEQRVWLL